MAQTVLLLKQVADCPYCENQIAVDAFSGEVILHQPCDEEAVAPLPSPDLFLDMRRGRPLETGRLLHLRTTSVPRAWLWEHGRGIYPVNVLLHNEHMEWIYYLCDYGWESLPPERRLTIEHEFSSAQERHASARRRRPWSAEFVLGWDGRRCGSRSPSTATRSSRSSLHVAVQKLRKTCEGLRGAGDRRGLVAKFLRVGGV